MKNKKGSTIVEVVVAMAVIITISSGLVSAFLTTNRVNEKSSVQYFATNEINNLRECFLKDKFKIGADSALSFYFGNDAQPFRLTENNPKTCYVYSFYYDENLQISHGANTGYICVRFSVTKDLKRINMTAFRPNPDNPTQVQYLFKMNDNQFDFVNQY